MSVVDPRRGKVKKCQFWAHAVDDRSWQGPAPPAVAYIFAESRGTKEIVAQLMNFKGVLQVDGYAAYRALEKNKITTGIELAFCLTHSRRNFVSVSIDDINQALAELAKEKKPRSKKSSLASKKHVN